MFVTRAEDESVAVTRVDHLVSLQKLLVKIREVIEPWVSFFHFFGYNLYLLKLRLYFHPLDAKGATAAISAIFASLNGQ